MSFGNIQSSAKKWTCRQFTQVLQTLSHRAAVPGTVQPRTRNLEVAPQILCVLPSPPISTLGTGRAPSCHRLHSTADVRHVLRELAVITKK